jgi:hypothetical protein
MQCKCTLEETAHVSSRSRTNQLATPCQPTQSTANTYLWFKACLPHSRTQTVHQQSLHDHLRCGMHRCADDPALAITTSHSHPLLSHPHIILLHPQGTEVVLAASPTWASLVIRAMPQPSSSQRTWALTTPSLWLRQCHTVSSAGLSVCLGCELHCNLKVEA